MIRNKLTKLRNPFTRDKEGGNDVVTAMFTLPAIIILIFTMIDLSSYFQARSTIQSAAQDGARMVALYGGQSGEIPLNNFKKPVQQLILPKVYDAAEGRCLPSACRDIPKVTCTPEIVTESMGLGTEVSCTILYKFAPASAGLAQMIGFGDLLTADIEITQSSISETYYMG